jgi:hypothetical protein
MPERRAIMARDGSKRKEAPDKGDAAAAAATHSATADLAIIDEVSWLIHGWTWTGPKPKAIAPAKPKPR